MMRLKKKRQNSLLEGHEVLQVTWKALMSLQACTELYRYQFWSLTIACLQRLPSRMPWLPPLEREHGYASPRKLRSGPTHRPHISAPARIIIYTKVEVTKEKPTINQYKNVT
jgi:hypothetical protein